jgi:hypothetical protein
MSESWSKNAAFKVGSIISARSSTDELALPDQCLHSAEADVRPPRRTAEFDQNGHFRFATDAAT